MAGNNIHVGHRQRLKDRFVESGASVFEKHQLLELLLFYGIPQKDTNPIAHELINKFGTLRAIFEANIDELCTVNGISEHTATLIKLVPEMWKAAASEVDTKKRYDSLNKLGDLLIKRYAGITVETILLVLLDNSWHIIDIVNIGEGSVNQVRLNTRELVEVTLRKNAAMALLAHNHPNGVPIPSSEDLVTTDEVAKAFRTIHVDFLEHLLVADGRFEPLLSKTQGSFWQRSSKEDFYR